MEFLRGAQTSRIGYDQLSSIRISRPMLGQAVLGLVSRERKKTKISLIPASRSDSREGPSEQPVQKRLGKSFPAPGQDGQGKIEKTAPDSA